MSGETPLSIVGNLTADPELRFTADGKPVASFQLASTPRTYDANTRAWVDGKTVFMRCTAWGSLAENLAESLTKGNRVWANGVLVFREWEARDGSKRSGIELTVEDAGPSLRWATGKVTRTPGAGSGGGRAAPSSSTGWTSSAEEPPF